LEIGFSERRERNVRVLLVARVAYTRGQARGDEQTYKEGW
jgi:hypothetical protein